MKTFNHRPSRLDDIINRQRASRLRDVVFVLLLAVGIGVSIRALDQPSAAAPSLTAATAQTAPAVS